LFKKPYTEAEFGTSYELLKKEPLSPASDMVFTYTGDNGSEERVYLTARSL
jgi:hypothetical protein